MLQGIVTAAHSLVSLIESASLQGSNDKQIARLSDSIEIGFLSLLKPNASHSHKSPDSTNAAAA